jgi:hypothetical protein
VRTFRIHWPAVIVAMLVSFLFEAAWFYHFLTPWLEGIGRTMQSLQATGMSPAIQYATALLCSFIAAIVLTILIQWTGQQTLLRGITVGALVWIGFVATSWAKEYIFEVRTLKIFLINTVYCLIDLVLIGAIVGAWKPKSRITTL